VLAAIGMVAPLVATGAVVVTLVMAAMLINRHYAYFPTPAALFGRWPPTTSR